MARRAGRREMRRKSTETCSSTRLDELSPATSCLSRSMKPESTICGGGWCQPEAVRRPSRTWHQARRRRSPSCHPLQRPQRPKGCPMDHVASRQLEVLGEVRDHFRHLPDHLVQVPFCRVSPFTFNEMEPSLSRPVSETGWIGPTGADRSNALPISQGRPSFFCSPCRSRRVMSSDSA